GHEIEIGGAGSAQGTTFIEIGAPIRPNLAWQSNHDRAVFEPEWRRPPDLALPFISYSSPFYADCRSLLPEGKVMSF
ncbi:hypothetical protein, partial [Citromicrobium bathyomarinum]|uniref:hypothetical protein n=1 Tax=Citromicrobium bathyomarinum TaxID=72174 RepID=UPI001F160E72